MRFCRIIYKSKATSDTPSALELNSILDQGILNNDVNGITGMLIVSGQEYLQLLEGEWGAVSALLAKLYADPRHTDLRIVGFEEISTGLFDTWTMRVFDLDTLPDTTYEQFAEKFPCLTEQRVLPETYCMAFAMMLDAKFFCRSPDD